MRCKDCIHYEVCMDYTTLSESEFAQNFNETEKLCDYFRTEENTPHCWQGKTNYHRVKSMNVGELADFLADLSGGGSVRREKFVDWLLGEEENETAR